jgi:RHS repeat-associated protein
VKTDRYFAGRRLAVMDRLGSVRGNKYLPFGEEQPASANDTDKFATYFRDSSTGLDYAVNRYYGSNMGRFLTPDPYGGSPNLARPSSWNRYSYVEGDPVNNTDRSGLFLDGTSRGEGGWVFWVDVAFDFGGRGGGHPPLVPLDGPPPDLPMPRPRGTVPIMIDGLEIRIECGDGHLLGIGVQLSGPSSVRIGDLYEIPANTIAAVKVEQDGKIVIGSSNPISYDGPGPWNAHVSRFTFNKDGTYHSSDISLDYGPDRAAEFFLRRELRKVSNMTNVISQIPWALSKIGDLTGICR